MKFMAKAENDNRTVRNIKRSVSVLLAGLLVVGTFAVIPFMTNADDEILVKNYPLLREVGETGPNGDNWTYNVHDYAEKPDFKTSDTQFTAPTAVIDEDGGVSLSWTAFGSADKYTVNVYDSTNTLSFTTDVSDTSVTVSADEFTEGEYQVQLIAFKGSNELGASMVRPFEYKDAVTEADLLTDLGGNIQSGGGRSAANATDDADALERAPVTRLHAHTLSKSACFWFNTISALPDGTQAVAFWYSQKFPEDESYYALRFQLMWQNIGSASYASNRSFYFIPANTTDKIHSTSTDSQGYSLLDSNGKNGEFIEGWVVVPLSNYTDAYKNTIMSQSNLNLRIYWATAKTLVKADGTTDKSATNGDSRRHYISNLHAVSDLDAFLGLYKSEIDNSYAASGQTDYECDTYNTTTKEFYNQNSSANKYTLNTSDVTFNLTDDAVGTKGMQLSFTAPENGYYDLSQTLSVTGNASAVGTIYYRVTGGNGSTFYPKDGGWLTLGINGTNPSADLSAATTYLKEGEALTLEAYADLTAGGSIKISIGNPTATYVEYAFTGAGEYLSYSAFDYFLSSRDMATPYYINDRFEFYMLNYTSSITTPEVKKFTKYNKAWSNSLYYNDDTEIIGFWGMNDYDEDEHLKFKGVNKHAPQITYNVTDDGILNIELPLRMQTGDIEVRILKNSDQIWPTSGFYTVADGESVTISTDVNVTAGDKINIQLYTDSFDLVEGYTNPVFSYSATIKNNSAPNKIYSPLWERPYSFDSDYVGEYTEAPGSLFSFGISSGVGSTAMDSYDSSKGNYLYNSTYPASGFTFGEDDLIYSVSDKAAGMSITFTAPYVGKYDISSALKVVSGSGSASYKIVKGNTELYSKDFTAAPGNVLEIPATFVELDVGDTVQLVLTASPESADPVVFNLGTPVVCYFNNIITLGSETTDVYTPSSFTAFEAGKVSTRLSADARFEYVLKSGGKEHFADKYNTAERTVTYNSTGFTLTDTGAVTVNVNNTAYEHILRFTAPKDTSGAMQFELSSDIAATVTVTKNGTAIGTYTATAAVTPISLDMKLSKGDVVELSVKSASTGDVNLGVVNITDLYHITDYNASSNSYNALAGNPFGDTEYTGHYKRYDTEYWLYDIAEITADGVEYIVPNSYDSENGKYLYSSETDNGYYFGDTLNATLINSEDATYGISLGFTAPRTDSFIFRTGLRILTDSADAKLNTRITLNGETVWSGDADEWYSSYSSTGYDVDVPLQLLSLSEGDVLRFEVYAEEIFADGDYTDKIKISLVSPELICEASKVVENDDITATVVYPYDEFQYRSIAYTGEYIPMENRWNYEFATFGETVEIYQPDYYSGEAVDLYSKTVTNSPHYNLKSYQYKMTASTGDIEGINLRYTSAADAETIFRLIPKITAGADNAKVMYRVLNGDTVIWPTAESGKEWEILTAENPESEIENRLSIDLKVGDDITVQMYAESISGEDSAVTVTMNAFAAVVSTKRITRTSYAMYNSNTSPIQLSPFWSYEYALDPDNIEWELMETYGNSYYSITGTSYCGVNGKLPLLGLTNSGSFVTATSENQKIPIIAITLTAPETGYYRLDKAALTLYAPQEKDIPAKVRITVNDEVVWPTDGSNWVSVGTGNISDYANMSIQMDAGDKLRFEATGECDYDTLVNDLSRFRLKWPVVVSYSLFDIVYTDTDDIFNMLTPEMYEYYQKLLNSGMIFDDNPVLSIIPSEDTAINNGNTNNGFDNTGNDGYYVEGTEDQVIVTGGKRRKIVTYTTSTGGFPWWIVILICSIAAVLLIATVVVIIVLHKKGKISWFKRRKNKKAQS